MNIYKKNYQNIIERKSHLTVKSKDHTTLDFIESQALDAFCVEASEKEFLMQRMGQLQILPTGKKRYNLRYYKNQTRITIPAGKRKIQHRTQTLDNFIIKAKQKPKNLMQRPVYFRINQKPQKKIFIEEQLDSFMCSKKLKPALKLQNVNNVVFEREKKPNNRIESLNRLKLPATGKFFYNRPVLKSRNVLELEYLKIKAPLKCINSSNLLLPLKPKKIKYTNLDIKTENSSNLLYIINKTKIFHPSLISIANDSSLLIPQQPKKTSFTEIMPEKSTDILYDIIPKKKTFDEITIDSIPDIFIQEQSKKRYYTMLNTDNMSIKGIDKPLEIDPNEEIFIPNVYDMLLIQNYWDDLSIESSRLCLRPKVNKIRLNQNNKFEVNNDITTFKEKEKEEVNENKNKDNEIDKDVLKDFKESNKKIIEIKKSISNSIIYEDRDENEDNIDSIREKDKKDKENSLKESKYNDLTKKIKKLKIGNNSE